MKLSRVTINRSGCSTPDNRLRIALTCFTLTWLVFALTGCATNWQTAGLAAGITAAGARSPSTEMEQIYYLGVFDPQEQVPPAIYRVTVHGQASLISLARFASGWVPAEVADSLTSSIDYNDQGVIKVTKDTSTSASTFQTGRRLVMFGPEGFREAPRNHRLVIIMGSNPSEYFNAVNQVMNKLSLSGKSAQNDALVTQILLQLTQVEGEKDRLQHLLDTLPAASPTQD